MRVFSLLALLLCAAVVLLSRPVQAANPLSLQQIKTDHGIFYYITIPHDAPYKVEPGISEVLMPLEKFNLLIAADETNLKPLPALINAGFFDPSNQETISYATLDGEQVLDPSLNKRLTQNEALKPYLEKIFNRTEFRIYSCNGQTRYDITRHKTQPAADCTLVHALGAGPALLPKRTDREEAFIDTNAQGKVTRDPVGVKRRDARSAVGLTCKGDVIIAMGSQNPEKSAGTGFTLTEMSDLLKQLGAVQAMALDGGSSSGIMVEGQTVYGKYGKSGVIKRPVKTFLMALPE